MGGTSLFDWGELLRQLIKTPWWKLRKIKPIPPLQVQIARSERVSRRGSKEAPVGKADTCGHHHTLSFHSTWCSEMFFKLRRSLLVMWLTRAPLSWEIINSCAPFRLPRLKNRSELGPMLCSSAISCITPYIHKKTLRKYLSLFCW
jgi:hypothetical protein